MNDPHRQLFLLYRDHGDITALGKLFDELSAELFRLALYLAPDASDAEDLVQNTFLSAIESRKNYDESRPVRPWLTGILANLARRRRRDLARNQPSPLPEGLPASGDADTAAAAGRDEIRSQLRESLRGLSQPYRQVLTLHLEEGMTARRIGEVMERPAGTVRSQIVRGLDILRKSLPAGVSGGLAYVLTSGHALAGVRVEVLRAATQLADAAPVASAATPPAALSWTLPHRLLVATALLAGAAVIWWQQTTPAGPPTPAPTETAGGRATASVEPGALANQPSPTVTKPPSRTTAPQARTQMRVRLVDASGNPQAGLTCQVVDTSDPRRLFLLSCIAEDFEAVSSGRDGWVTVETGAANRHLLWVVGTDLRMQLPNSPPPDGITWRVPKLHPYEGVVRSQDGTGLGGVDVFASSTAGSMESNPPLTQTKPDGTFAFMLPTSRSYVWAAGNGVRSAATPSRGSNIELTAITAQASINITVMTPDGLPANDAFVAAFFEAKESALRPPIFARADARGAATLTGLPQGRVIVTARSGDRTATRQRIDLNGVATYPITLRLQEGAQITGRVVDLGGNPVRDCVVYAQAPQILANSFDGRLFDRIATTQDDGSYHLTGLPSGNIRLRLTSKTRPREFANQSIELAAGEQRELDWKVNQRILRGRVLGLENPAAFYVTAAPADPTGQAFSPIRFREPIGPDGSFAMPLPPRTSAVTLHLARKDNPAPLIYYCARAVVNDTAKPVELAVTPAQARYATLNLHLNDTEDRGAKVSLTRGSQTIYATMNDQGLVSFAHVAAGDYTLRVARRDGFVWTHGLHITGDQRTVELADLQSEPQGLLTVNCDGAAQLEVRDERGCLVKSIKPAVATALEAGSYTLSVSGPDVSPQVTPLTINAAEEARHVVDVDTGLRCNFEFSFDPVDNNRDVSAALRIALFDDQGDLITTASVERTEEGLYRWSQMLAPGGYRVQAIASWGGVASGIAKIAGDSPVTWQATLTLP